MNGQTEWMLQEELHDLGKCLLVWWDWQNRHLEQLVDLKSKEIWSMGLEENDEDIDVEMEREELGRLTAEEQTAEVGGVAAVVAGLMAEAKKAKEWRGWRWDRSWSWSCQRTWRRNRQREWIKEFNYVPCTASLGVAKYNNESDLDMGWSGVAQQSLE